MSPIETSPLNSPLPPIVLLVEDDRQTLEATSRYFDRAGLWTATASDPDEALLSAQELRPDIVVTDLRFGQYERGTDLLHELKHTAGMENVPVIVLADSPFQDVQDWARDEADLILEKPIPCDQLLERVRETIHTSCMLRARGCTAKQQGTELREESHRLRRESRATAAAAAADRLEATARTCPKCGSRLEWIERRALGGSDYDYYHWCFRGCGLYCYDRTTHHWLKLAG